MAVYWLDNPFRVWRVVKARCVEKGRPVRVCMNQLSVASYRLSVKNEWFDFPQYAGYLFRVNGNCFLLAKFGKAHRWVTFPELMGLCLSGKLSIDDERNEMPEYYEKYCKGAET